MTYNKNGGAPGMEVAPSGNTISKSFTRPADTNAYAAGDVVGTSPATNLVFEKVLEYPGATFMITDARLMVDVASVPAGCNGYRLHLFKTAPTAILDNAPFNLVAADRSKYLGYITISAPVDFGDTIYSQDLSINFVSKMEVGSTTLYGVFETLGAYTPSSAAIKTITLNVMGV